MFIHCLFDNSKNKHDYYGDEDCIKTFCKKLKEYVTEIINYKNKGNNIVNKTREKIILKTKFLLYM